MARTLISVRRAFSSTSHRPDGSLELVAVENLVFAAAWRAAGHTEPPTFHGVPYDSMRDDPSTG